MSIDRTIDWKEESKRLAVPWPTRQEIQHLVEDFFGGECVVQWASDVLFVSLCGKPTSPFDRIVANYPKESQDKRWIEIHSTQKQMTITTRMQDEFTNCLADGLAKVFSRYWEGKLDLCA